MAPRRNPDVVVAGAGPTGMLAALALARRGLKVVLLDEQHRTAARSYALALHPRSLELLGEEGLAGELVEAGHRIETLAFFEGEDRKAEVRFSRTGSPHPFLLVLPQSALERALERRLTERGVEVLWSHRLAGLDLDGPVPVARVERLGRESSGYSVQTTEWVVESEVELASRFVVGADGHRSRVRRALGIAFDELLPSRLFAVFELTADRPAGPEARVMIQGGATSVLWPVAHGRFRFGFEVGEGEVRAERRQKSSLVFLLGDESFAFLEPGMLRRLLAERAPWFDAPVGQVAWSLAVRFERRLAASYGRGGVWLVGDAAHLGHPVGMLSMNAGLEEAATLADRVDAVANRGANPNLLDDWGRERRQAWRDLVDERGRPAPAGADAWLSEHKAEVADCLPATGAHRAKLLEALGLG